MDRKREISRSRSRAQSHSNRAPSRSFMAATGISEFKEVLSDFKQLSSLALKGAVAAPLANAWLKIGPPPAKAIGALTTLVEFVAVVFVFQVWFNGNQRKLQSRMLIALGIFLVGLLSSL